MFCILAWLDTGADERRLEDNVPLRFLAGNVARFACREQFRVLFLEGYERLSRGYLDHLRGAGLEPVDCTAFWPALLARHAALQRFGRYEMYCFLRWLALAAYLERETVREQVFHLDGDVLFNVSPDRIAADLRGRTFVLQGCPALVSLSQPEWLTGYADQLARFAADPDGYSVQAWAERQGWEQSHRQQWAGFRDRPLISSDQDLLSHLIHTGRIPQDTPTGFARSRELYYAENPLYLHEHAELQLGRSSALRFASDGATCMVEDKPVAIWHFQYDFCRYLNTAILLHRLHYPYRCPNPLTNRFGHAASRLAGKIRPLQRRHLYEAVRELNPAGANVRLGFADLFNRRSFWQAGAFANSPADNAPGHGPRSQR